MEGIQIDGAGNFLDNSRGGANKGVVLVLGLRAGKSGRGEDWAKVHIRIATQRRGKGIAVGILWCRNLFREGCRSVRVLECDLASELGGGSGGRGG